MSDIKLIKCPYCGSIDKITNKGDKYKCGYCDSEFSIGDNNICVTLEEAHNDLIRYKFDDADDLYRKLSNDAEDKEDGETYATAEWGRLLAFFGVVYVKSFKKGSLTVPTFAKYNNRYNSVKECDHYKNIMISNANENTKNKYQEMANNLDDTYSRIARELNKVPEYDVFICTKISTTG